MSSNVSGSFCLMTIDENLIELNGEHGLKIEKDTVIELIG